MSRTDHVITVLIARLVQAVAVHLRPAAARVPACAMALLVAGSITHADVQPLASDTLDASLVAAGFTPEQRAAVLREHEAYVGRFVGAAEGPLPAWEVSTNTKPASEEEAHAAVRAAKSAASAIEALEAPLYEAIQSTATAEQQVAAQRIIDRLKIRMERSLLATVGTEPGAIGLAVAAPRTRDVLALVENAGLTPTQLAAIDPHLGTFVPAFRESLRRERDAATERPLNRLKGGDPEFGLNLTLPGEDGPPPSAEALQQAVQDHMRARQEAYQLADAERHEAARKSLRAEITLLEGILPSLNGRAQAQLLADWSRTIGFSHDTSARRLKLAWGRNPPKTPEQERLLDEVCSSWRHTWFPKAGSFAISTIGKDPFDALFAGSALPADDSGKDIAVMATAAAEAAKRINEILGVEVTEAADGRVARGAGGLHQGAIQFEGSEEPSFEVGAVIVISEGTPGGWLDGEGGDVVAMEGLMPAALTIAVDGAELIAGESSFIMVHSETTTGESASSGSFNFSFSDMGARRNFPRRVEWAQVAPLYESLGTDEAMLPVAEAMWNLMLEDGATLNQQHVELLRSHQPNGVEGLRAQCIDLLRSKTAEVNETALSSDALAAAAWLPAWVCGAIQPPVHLGMDPMNRPPVDLGAVVLKSELTGAEWLRVGAVFASVVPGLEGAIANASATTQRVQDAYGDLSHAPGDQPPDYKLMQELSMAQADASTRLVAAFDTAAEQMRAALEGEASIRFRDAFDDARFREHLRDRTDMASRFEQALAQELAAEQRSAVESLQAAWKRDSRAHRNAIVAQLKDPAYRSPSDPQRATTRRDAALAALKFDRSEANRRAFRALQGTLGPELATKVPQLPASRSLPGVGGQFAFQTVQTLN
ncbi:MAG: hypothetical protein O2819_03845 [Planctomycetota bacterium]|nr:hypothetical protein [Planctomycetota bacterium]MDA1105829.1 hypothetical protein [Planctomycetota bacterium]